MIRFLRGPSALGVGLATACALLSGSIFLGLRVPDAGHLSRFPEGGGLDYSSVAAGSLTELSPQYIAQVLGTGLSAGSLSAVQSSRGPTLSSNQQQGIVSHPFTNRDFAHAYDIHSVPFAAQTDTRSETRQPGEPTSCSVVGGTAWYRYVPATSRTLQADTSGTNYATSLGVFAGDRLDDLKPVGCATSATGDAAVGFLALGREPYYFQIAGPAGGGTLRFTLAPHVETVLLTTLLQNYQGVPDDPRIFAGAGVSPDFRSGVLVGNVSPSARCDGSGHGNCGQVWYGEVSDFRDFHWQLVSVSSSGKLANGASSEAKVSAGGRYVAFDSVADNLVAGDTNGISDIFVRDRRTGITTRESLTRSGRQLRERPLPPLWFYGSGGEENGSYNPYISGDGRYLAYESNAAGLGPGDTCTPHVNGAIPHGCFQVLLRDRLRRTTTLVTAAASGVVGNDESILLGMTPDGRYLLIGSLATNLLPGPTTGCAAPKSCFALLLWDRLFRHFELESVSSRGGPADGQINIHPTGAASISPEGRFVSFASDATNLVSADTHGTVQTYLHDRATGRTELVSVNDQGAAQGDDPRSASLTGLSPTPQYFEDAARYSSVSEGGRYVAFDSAAGLVPGVGPGYSQVYVRDRVARRTILISVNTSGQPGDAPSQSPFLSRDGKLVMFASLADDLVANDNNHEPDGFWRGWQQ